MTLSRNTGLSRPGSSRATSTARDTIKKRDKPYKTEKARVLTKRRKLDLHISYKKAPAGYAFLPVGTPDLAERCKELSRQKGVPVDVVNAKPVSKHATDPCKVSHHIHRIGYHFRADIVEEACTELGYTPYRDKFIKEVDLQAQHQQSRMAEIMAKHGLPYQPAKEETPEQVAAVIKELFPRMPDSDMNQILRHAWAEGSKRVGTNVTLDLPRRVQLATIARIRHTYTDYDYLLHAFQWKDARSEVEGACLQKLLEWRGEHTQEDDDLVEELVRDVIVLDDDEENNAGRGSEADDEDSTMEVDDNASDTSIEITHERIVDKDFRVESTDEESRGRPNRHLSSHRTLEYRNNIARQRIGEARRQMQIQDSFRRSDRVQIQGGSQPSARVHLPYGTRTAYVEPGRPVTVDHPTYGLKHAPETIHIGGQVFVRMPEERQQPPPPSLYAQHPAEARRITSADYTRYVESPRRYQVGSYAELHDRPIPSIEHDTTYPQQQTPYVPVSAHERVQRDHLQRVYAAKAEMERPVYRREVVDLTTPEPQPAPYDPRQPWIEMPRRHVSQPQPQPQHGAPAPVQPYRRY